MKEISGYLGIPIFLLVSSWGAMKTVLEVIEKLNGIRNFALGLGELAQNADNDMKRMIFYNDWIPLALGLFLFLIVFAAVFAMIPMIFKVMHEGASGDELRWSNALLQKAFWKVSHIQFACYGFSLLSVFVALAHLVAGISDWYLVESKL